MARPLIQMALDSLEFDASVKVEQTYLFRDTYDPTQIHIPMSTRKKKHWEHLNKNSYKCRKL